MSYALSQKFFFVVCFLHTSGHFVFLRRLAGVHHISPVVLWTLSLGWVGAPNEHATFRVRDAVIDFVDQCLTRSRIADQGVRVSPKLCGPCPCKICEDRRVCMCDRCRCVVQAGVATRFPGVKDALLFVLIRALYCASLQCVWCRTHRRQDELKCGLFFAEVYSMLRHFSYWSGHHASHTQ